MSEKKSGEQSGAKERQGLEIQVDDVTAQGVYSNGMMVNFNENEFTLDFLYVQPIHTKARVRSRVIVTPNQARRLLKILSDNIQRYDNRFNKNSMMSGGPGNSGTHGPGTPIH